MSYKVCAYYTSKKYKKLIDKLETSLKKYSINYFFKYYEDRGSWKKNTGIKPEFLLEMLNENSCDIVYLDADSIVKKYPKLFDDFKYDIGILFSDKSDFSNKVLTGTIILKNNSDVKKFVEDWVSVQRESEDYTDQDSIDIILDRHESLKFFDLPFSYVKIFDRDDSVEPVIEHYQASRKFNLEKINKRNIFKRTIHKIKMLFY